jgi:hypothetical protein
MWFFLHVVKTGGTTLFKHIEKHFPNSRRVNIGIRPKSTDEFISGHCFAINLNSHKPFKNVDPRYITIIRDPADWLLSVYHQDMSRRDKIISFRDWYDCGNPNSVIPGPTRARDRMTKYLENLFCCNGVENIIYHLNNTFYKVFITDKLNIDLPKFFKELGINEDFESWRVCGKYSKEDKKIIPKLQEMTPDLRNMIYKQNTMDLKIYVEARRIRGASNE